MQKAAPPWIRRYHSKLYHYGVKGMHWGVRRTPEELGHKPKKTVAKSGASDTIVMDAIKSGAVKKEINREKQMRHCKGEPGYIPGRSYIDGDLNTARQLVEELSGTGHPLIGKDGKWLHKERVTASKAVGANVDPSTNEESRTDRLVITYSKTGSHIMPGKENKR